MASCFRRQEKMERRGKLCCRTKRRCRGMTAVKNGDWQRQSTIPGTTTWVTLHRAIPLISRRSVRHERQPTLSCFHASPGPGLLLICETEHNTSSIRSLPYSSSFIVFSLTLVTSDGRLRPGSKLLDGNLQVKSNKSLRV